MSDYFPLYSIGLPLAVLAVGCFRIRAHVKSKHENRFLTAFFVGVTASVCVWLTKAIQVAILGGYSDEYVQAVLDFAHVLAGTYLLAYFGDALIRGFVHAIGALWRAFSRPFKAKLK